MNGGLALGATLTNNGSFILGANNTISSLINSGQISGTGNTLTAATYLLQNGSNVSANLGIGTLTTTGTATLSGTSAADNVTVSAASTLNITGAQLLSSGAAVNVNGTLNLSGATQTINTLNGTGGTVTANTLQVNGGGAFSGSLATTSFILGGGSLTLDSILFNTTSLTLDTGATLTLQNTTGPATATTVTLNSNSTLDLSTNAVLQTTTIQQNPGSILIVPTSSHLTYTLLTGYGNVNTLGNLFTNIGTVTGFEIFSNDFENLGTLSPGFSPGVIIIHGNYTEGGQLILDIQNSTPITGFDQIQVGGTATFLSTSSVEVQMAGGAVVPGNTFQVISNSVGGPIAISGAVGALSLTVDAAPVNPSTIVFDLGTGRIIVTGVSPAPIPGPVPPSPTNSSIASNLGTTKNERRIADAILNAGLIGPNQINSDTPAGLFASEILTGNAAAKLAYFDPTYYGSMADIAFMGDRAMAAQVWNRVSVFEHQPLECCGRVLSFAGYLEADAMHVHHSNLRRREAFVGVHYSTCPDFSFGGAVSYNLGNIKSTQGKDHIVGAGVLLYLRRTLNDSLTAYGTVSCSFLNNHLHRPTLNGKVHGNTQAQAGTAYLALQYKGWSYKTFSFVPRANLTYSLAHINRFSEKGAIDALHDNGLTASLFTGELGFSAIYAPIPEVEMELIGGVEEPFTWHKTNMNMYVISSPDIFYSLILPNANKITVNGGINLRVTPQKGISFFGGYEAMYGEGWGYLVNAGLTICFGNML